jgi:hypothetical protein
MLSIREPVLGATSQSMQRLSRMQGWLYAFCLRLFVCTLVICIVIK